MVIFVQRGVNDLHNGPADATAISSPFAPVKSRMVYLSGTGLPRLSWKMDVAVVVQLVSCKA